MKKIPKSTIIPAAGEPPKIIEEFIGRVNSGTSDVSIARMKSPSGWVEPPQKPDFDEYTVVFKGALHIKLDNDEFDVVAGESVIIPKGTRVQYSTPGSDGCEYMAVCIPAFSPDIVNREE